MSTRVHWETGSGLYGTIVRCGAHLAAKYGLTRELRISKNRAEVTCKSCLAALQKIVRVDAETQPKEPGND